MELTVPHNFTPRFYQLPFLQAMDAGARYAMLMWPRRHGKDKTAFAYLAKRMIKEKANYAYLFPTGSLAREAAWTNIDKDGFALIDHIPKELIKKRRDDQMFLELVNGSTLKFFGSDKKDSVGPNYKGIVLSEFALMNPQTYFYLRPIIRDNKGFIIIASTVRGKNHYYDLWNMAKEDEEWFTQKLTWEDCQQMTQDDIDAEIRSGMSEEMIRSEYYNDFAGLEGSYYIKYIDKMRADGRIKFIPHDPYAKVYTAWDIGVHDATTIIWFQIIGQEIHILECYSNNNVGLDHYAKIIHSKDYLYEKHFAPHDIKVKEWGNNAISRHEMAYQLGIEFDILETLSISVLDGIELCRSMFHKVWINEKTNKELIISLENYRKDFDKKRNIYVNYPIHDKFSHFADGFRYAMIGVKKEEQYKNGLSMDDISLLNHKRLRI